MTMTMKRNDRKRNTASHDNTSTMLPWKYPPNYYCQKCHNTGYKQSSGKSCKDCWGRFARKNSVQYVPPPVEIPQPGLHIPFTNRRINDDFNIVRDPGQIAVYQPPPPARPPVPVPVPTALAQRPPPAPLSPPDEPPPYDMYQKVPQAAPASPYQGQPSSFPYPPPPPPPPLPQTAPYVPYNYNYNYNYGYNYNYNRPRVVNPGDPSLGGVLCGRCRGKGYTGGFLLGEETCSVCAGTGRVF